jgi:hypothetical protein
MEDRVGNEGRCSHDKKYVPEALNGQETEVD